MKSNEGLFLSNADLSLLKWLARFILILLIAFNLENYGLVVMFLVLLTCING